MVNAIEMAAIMKANWRVSCCLPRDALEDWDNKEKRLSDLGTSSKDTLDVFLTVVPEADSNETGVGDSNLAFATVFEDIL